MNVSDYNALNSSYDKKLVFHLGANSGFFSEFNNMVLAMVYCLHEKIQFTLYSSNANFSVEHGWSDFFVPFCPETTSNIHKKFNDRFPPDTFKIRHAIGSVIKKLAGFEYYTFDLWNFFHSREFAQTAVNFGEEPNCSVRDAARQIIKMIWKYNDETRSEIHRYKSELNLPRTYAGVHVRAGDKIIESQLYDPHTYMGKLKELSPERDIFLLTDDYAIFQELQSNYPDYNFYTLCTSDDRGYSHASFTEKNAISRAVKLKRLFASMDILAESNLFVGTYSTNPGMYLGMRMESEKIHCIDFPEWRIW